MLNHVSHVFFACAIFVLVGCDGDATVVRSPQSITPDDILSPERAEAIVGTWQWKWRQGTIHHVVLDANGRAAKVEGRDQFHRNGTWHVRDDGILEVTMKMEFRIDDNEKTVGRTGEIELMDLETIRTERDFPWRRINSRTDLPAMPTELTPE